jgi:hypothetical protein
MVNATQNTGIENRAGVGYISQKVGSPGLERMVHMDHAVYLWRDAYQAAVCETDDSLIPGRILEARSAIEQRLLSPIETDSEEYRAIKNAEKALEILKAERVHKTPVLGIHSPSKPSQSTPQA